MYRTQLTVAAALLAAVSGTAVSATNFVGSYTVQANVADPGLVVITNPSSGALNFNLATGGSTAVNLFSISTGETSVNDDDLNGKQIKVNFAFTAPSAASGSVTGSTVGETTLFGLFQNGSLTWNGPASFNFGGNGILTVALNNVTFGSGLLGLTSAPAQVTGTFSLAPAAVPEPASWAMMIGGFGLIGSALRRRQQVAVRFA